MLSQFHTISNSELVTLPQFVVWHYDGGRKVPINPKTLRQASSNKPSTWSDYETALEVADRGGYGLGFVVTSDDRYCFIDIDKCINDGEVAAWAQEIVDSLNSYTEISPSGGGLRIWVKASKPGLRCKQDYETGKVEIYDSGQFSTVTNRVFADKPIQERQEALEALYWRIFPEQPATPPKPISSPSMEDSKVLELARKAKSGAEFAKLYDHSTWTGYPSPSEADMKLCGMLAFWTGCDEEQMVRLFMGSRRATNLNRKSDPDSYVERTVLRAIKNCNNVYDPNYERVVEQDVKDILLGVERASIADAWKGRSGPTDRDVLAGIINTGLVHGRLVDGGVRVAVSVRDLALASGINRYPTVRAALRRLEARDWIKKLEDGRAKSAAIYLIKACAKPIHNNLCKYYVSPLRTTRRIRNPSQMVTTITKRSGQILDYVHAQEGCITLAQIAGHFGVRERDTKRRNLNLLLELGLLEESEDGYRTPEDVEARLLQELEDSGTLAAEQLQKERIAREREAYANREAPPPCQPKVPESQGVEDMQDSKATVTYINTVSEERGYEVYSWVFDLLYGFGFVPVPIIMKACADEGITSAELQYAFDHLPIEEEFDEDDLRVWQLAEEPMDVAA